MSIVNHFRGTAFAAMRAFILAELHFANAVELDATNEAASRCLSDLRASISRDTTLSRSEQLLLELQGSAMDGWVVKQPGEAEAQQRSQPPPSVSQLVHLVTSKRREGNLLFQEAYFHTARMK